MPGVFVAGDCRIGAAMQLVTAVADGVNAALMLKTILPRSELVEHTGQRRPPARWLVDALTTGSDHQKMA